MEIRTGVDIIEISRKKESIEQIGQVFLDRIYTEKEQEYCEKSNKMKYQHYAARFAAKEAIFKAISGLLKNKFDISWHNAQVINDKNGNPQIEFLDIKFDKLKSIDISISHCKEYAVATVVAVVED